MSVVGDVTFHREGANAGSEFAAKAPHPRLFGDESKRSTMASTTRSAAIGLAASETSNQISSRSYSANDESR